tara:strand:+ start:1062 stop:1976 length:915 start_codon:yes stop_codon:yes gene_type:complete
MNVYSLFRKAAQVIPNLTELREVFLAANRVIADINSKWPGELHTDQITRLWANTEESVTFAQAGGGDTMLFTTNLQSKGVEEHSTIYILDSSNASNNGQFDVQSCVTVTVTITQNTVLSAGTETVNAAAFTLVNSLYPDTSSTIGKDYNINARTNEITVDPKVKQILSVFVNNIELECVDREFVLDSDNKQYACYSMISRDKFVYPEQVFATEGDVMSIKMLKKIPYFPDSALIKYTTNTINMPLVIEELLFAGVLMMLLSKPQYSDEKALELNTAMYTTGLVSLSQQELDRSEPITRELNYKY